MNEYGNNEVREEPKSGNKVKTAVIAIGCIALLFAGGFFVFSSSQNQQSDILTFASLAELEAAYPDGAADDTIFAVGDDVYEYNNGKWMSTKSIDGLGDLSSMEAIDGKDGKDGKDAESIYSILSANGFAGTEEELTNILNEKVSSSGETSSDIYDILAKMGYTGSKDDLISSLAGKDGVDGQDGRDGVDGRDGIDGQDGRDGINGKDGKDGKDGIDGKDGLNGTNGRDGIDGKDGRDGIDGKDGVDGKDGIDGIDGKDGVDGADGKTAYEYATEGGYTGTIEEFTEALAMAANPEAEDDVYELLTRMGYTGTQDEMISTFKGEKGDKGEQGEKGDKGTDGIDGSIVSLSANNTWIIDGVDTHVCAESATPEIYTKADGTKVWKIGDSVTDILAESKQIEFRTENGALQWKYTNETTWNDLYSYEDLKSEDVVLLYDAATGYIKWKHESQSDAEAINLINVAEMIPTIDSSGNWVINGTPIGISAETHDPIIQNNYWYLWNNTTQSYENSGVKAVGEDGADGVDGADG